MLIIALFSSVALISSYVSEASNENCVVFPFGCEDVDKICCTTGWRVQCHCSDVIPSTTIYSVSFSINSVVRDDESLIASQQPSFEANVQVVSTRAVSMDILILSGVVTVVVFMACCCCVCILCCTNKWVFSQNYRLLNRLRQFPLREYT